MSALADEGFLLWDEFSTVLHSLLEALSLLLPGSFPAVRVFKPPIPSHFPHLSLRHGFCTSFQDAMVDATVGRWLMDRGCWVLLHSCTVTLLTSFGPSMW